MGFAVESLRIEPAGPARWDDVVAVMGTRGDPSTCWCQFFHQRNAEWKAGGVADRRSALQQQVCGAGRAPGLLAYRGDDPVGWCQVGPKDAYDRLATARVAAAPREAPDPPGLWAITCFVVPVPHRGKGVASALLERAVEHARAHGAEAVEGYPVETDGTRRRSADIYHGTVTMFSRAGFAPVRRPSPTRAVMRLALRD